MDFQKLASFFEHKNRYLWLTLILAAFLAFWKLGDHGVHVWDEARHGVHGLEMAEGGDYVNYYFAGEVDTWSAKPPLFIWCMSMSYKIFGYNAWGMRIPAALGTILFFLFAFRLVNLYRSKFFAFATCVLLMSCTAILGPHVGRTGDFDAFLLPFLTGFAYHFARYNDFNKKNSMLWAGVFLGLAFYAKGTAAAFLVPGAMLYVLLSGTLLKILKDWRTYAGLGIFVFICGTWIYVADTYGATVVREDLKSTSALETLIFYDTFERFSSTDFAAYKSKPFFFFTALDIRMNLWNYFFYLAVLLGIVRLVRSGKSIFTFIRKEENRLALLSFSMVFSLALLLSLSNNKFNWYLAPVFLFVAAITMLFLESEVKRNKYYALIFAGIFAFLFGRHVDELSTPEAPMQDWLTSHEIAITSAEEIYMLNFQTEQQDLFLQLKWMNLNVRLISDLSQVDPSKKGALLFRDCSGVEAETPENIYQNYCLIPL